MKTKELPFTYGENKPHYALLDGLRGIAALIVIGYHIFEPFAKNSASQYINHGYLAVDFFFLLSGFVIGYAYDDRWKNDMTIKSFFKRRLIRLHPMVLMACLLGVTSFLVQGAEKWDGTKVSISCIMLAALMQMLMIPTWFGTSTEVRGSGEMYPLNGPSWSLFFEYIGNILYALWLRRLSTRLLSVFVILSGTGLTLFALYNLSGAGNIGVGWTFLGNNFLGGMLRMSFSFSAGLLMSRVFHPRPIRGAFWICSLILITLTALPYIGDTNQPWINALYEVVCVLIVFPFLVFLAASGRTTDSHSTAICKFLGDVSYPLYIIHYPSIYLLFMASRKYGMEFSQVWPYAILIFVGNILLAWILLKIYDEPTRRWLTKNWMNRNTQP